MNKYVFLRINEKFKAFFKGNLDAFIELYNRREESVFYKEQFKLFLTNNNKKEMVNFILKSIGIREGVSFISNKIILENKYKNNKEILETYDNYLLLYSNSEISTFKKYLLEYDSDFVIIDINNSKIETLPLVN